MSDPIKTIALKARALQVEKNKMPLNKECDLCNDFEADEYFFDDTVKYQDSTNPAVRYGFSMLIVCKKCKK